MFLHSNQYSDTRNSSHMCKYYTHKGGSISDATYIGVVLLTGAKLWGEEEKINDPPRSFLDICRNFKINMSVPLSLPSAFLLFLVDSMVLLVFMLAPFRLPTERHYYYAVLNIVNAPASVYYY